MRLHSIYLAIASIGLVCGGCVADGDAESAPSAQAAEVGGATTNASAFVLTVSASAESDITVTNSTSGNTCTLGATCNFAYLQGTVVTVHTEPSNLIDCRRFSEWIGACAGQGATCTLVMNSDLSTRPAYRFKVSNCTPR